MWVAMLKRNCIETLPEWSKGVDSSSNSASCVGSNPTGVNCLKRSKHASDKNIERDGDSKTVRDADRERERDRGRDSESQKERARERERETRREM